MSAAVGLGVVLSFALNPVGILKATYNDPAFPDIPPGPDTYQILGSCDLNWLCEASLASGVAALALGLVCSVLLARGASSDAVIWTYAVLLVTAMLFGAAVVAYAVDTKTAQDAPHTTWSYQAQFYVAACVGSIAAVFLVMELVLLCKRPASSLAVPLL